MSETKKPPELAEEPQPDELEVLAQQSVDPSLAANAAVLTGQED